jgi:hypothetical protein
MKSTRDPLSTRASPMAAARWLLPAPGEPDQGSAPILADNVERVLADMDADYSDFAIELL